VILFTVLLIAAAGAGGTLALRHRPTAVAAVGLLALAAVCLAAMVVPSGETLAVADAHLAMSAYARWFIVAAAGALFVVELAGIVHGSLRHLPLAALAGIGAVAAALTLTEPAAAILAATAAGLVGVVATLGEPVSMPTLRVTADGLRLVAVAGLLGLAGVAVVGTSTAHPSPQIVGAAVLAVGGAAAVRLGAFPLHIPTARLVETARLAAVPLVAAWLPAAFAAIALGWIETAAAATGAATPTAHVVFAVVGAVTIAVAGAVALVDDDLGRLVGYGLIADGGFVVLAAASADPAAFPAARIWLVCMGLSRSIMVAAIVGLEGSFGTRRVRDLGGWLRRQPLAAAALAAAALVGVGLPTMLPFEARRTLAVLALGEPIGIAALAFGALPLLGLARLALVGTRAPSAAVLGAPAQLPLRRLDRIGPWRERLIAVWQLDRAGIASAITLLLGLLALAAAVGVGDLAGAAAAAGPTP
jgi:NADH:ubiquinone oxidoreductase subunit 2 (subunit N)